MASSIPTTYRATTSKESAAPRRKLRRISIGRVLTYIILWAGVAVALVPFLWMTSASLMTLGEATGRAVLPSVPQWGNYVEAWEDANFSEYFVNSVMVTAITVSGQLVFCTLAAYAFARMEFPAKSFLFTLLLSTLMLPDALRWIPNFITVTWLGRIGSIAWVNNWPALTVPFMASAISVFLLRQFFAQIPEELWDSAQIDGAGHLRYLIQVVLPISRAPLMTIVIFGFIGAWNALAWPMLVTNTPEWRPISAGLMHFLDEAGAYVHLQMAGSVITILPILILYFITQKQFTEGIAYTGLKG